jgi:serine/threonine protein kinase
LDEEPDLKAIKQEADLWARAGGHPNVLPIIEADIYDGQVVITSEYAPNGSLEGWLKKHGGTAPSLDIAVAMVSGILAGLEHLHAKKIIHRDLKPANILLQGETPRLADFGLARVLKSSANTSGIAGTPVYMSPETFDGRRSERSDIWAVGVILFQLLSGRLPFPPKDIAALIGAIVQRDPEPLPSFVPSALQKIVTCALEKEPERRYQSATEMLTALQACFIKNKGKRTQPVNMILEHLPPTEPAIRNSKQEKFGNGTAIDSIAILPFESLNGDPDLEFFSDGVTESLINSMSQLSKLRVMARSTVFRYKGQDVDLQKIGRALNVRAVLTGRVIQRGDNLIIKAELVDVTDGSHLWGEQYNRKFTDILGIEEEIVKHISEKLLINYC